MITLEREKLERAIKAMLNSNSTSYEILNAADALNEALAQDEEWTPDDMAYRPGGLSQPALEPHPAVKSDMLVNGGALKLALNSLRRGTQSQQEIADELEKTAQPAQEPWMYRIWNDKDAQWRLTDDCSWPTEPIYTTPQQQEPRNFCPRCGKRLHGMAFAAGGIHTCTPPEGGYQ